MDDYFGKQRLLVIAPHADDEVIGSGGLIAKIKDLGGEVFVQVAGTFEGPDGLIQTVHPTCYHTGQEMRFEVELIEFSGPARSKQGLGELEVFRQLVGPLEKLGSEIAVIYDGRRWFSDGPSGSGANRQVDST